MLKFLAKRFNCQSGCLTPTTIAKRCRMSHTFPKSFRSGAKESVSSGTQTPCCLMRDHEFNAITPKAGDGIFNHLAVLVTVNGLHEQN